ncbi:MAG: acetoacetate decarboxylase family protein [Myxococcota bacterium]
MSADSYEFQGQTVTLPCIVRDAGSGNAIFLAPAPAVQALIPADAFEVVEAAPGQTQAILAVIDYRENDLGDYNEVGIIFMVRPRGAADDESGTFIYRLPVNQSFTCEAGCGIWGFPKTVDKIDYDYGSDAVTCRLEMDGQHVLTLTIPRGDEGSDSEELQTQTYTYIDGIPHETPFTTGGRGMSMNPGGQGVVLELGDHPLADELGGLGLGESSPILSTWTEHMTGSFGTPRKLP